MQVAEVARVGEDHVHPRGTTDYGPKAALLHAEGTRLRVIRHGQAGPRRASRAPPPWRARRDGADGGPHVRRGQFRAAAREVGGDGEGEHSLRAEEVARGVRQAAAPPARWPRLGA